MEEHKPGKRLASGSGKGAGRTLALLLAAAAVVLALAYVGLCAWVGASSTILPRVSAAGVGLGGLTQAQATERLNTGVAERYADASVNLTYSGQTAVFTGALVEADAEGGGPVRLELRPHRRLPHPGRIPAFHPHHRPRGGGPPALLRDGPRPGGPDAG